MLSPADFLTPICSFDPAAIMRAAHARARHGHNVGLTVLAGVQIPPRLQLSDAVATYARLAAQIDAGALTIPRCISYAAEFKAALAQAWADARGMQANARAAARWQASQRPMPMFEEAA